MVQDRHKTDATIEYMQYYLEEFHCHKDVLSWFLASYSTKQDSEGLKHQLILDNHEVWEINPDCKNLSTTAMCVCVSEDIAKIQSEIAQHAVNELDFNFVTMHLLNHFFDSICQLSNR